MGFANNNIDNRQKALAILMGITQKILLDFRGYMASKGKSYAIVDGVELFESISEKFIYEFESEIGSQMVKTVRDLIKYNSLSENDAPLVAQMLGESFEEYGVAFRMNVEKNYHIPNRYWVKFELSW